MVDCGTVQHSLIHPRYKLKVNHQGSYPFIDGHTSSTSRSDSNGKDTFFGHMPEASSENWIKTGQLAPEQLKSEPDGPLNFLKQEQSKNAKDNPFAYLDCEEALDKILEIKGRLKKFNSPKELKLLLAACWQTYAGTGECAIIDGTLANARRMSRFRDSMEQLNSE